MIRWIALFIWSDLIHLGMGHEVSNLNPTKLFRRFNTRFCDVLFMGFIRLGLKVIELQYMSIKIAWFKFKWFTTIEMKGIDMETCWRLRTRATRLKDWSSDIHIGGRTRLQNVLQRSELLQYDNVVLA